MNGSPPHTSCFPTQVDSCDKSQCLMRALSVQTNACQYVAYVHGLQQLGER
jgi:hypothetical protein